MHPFAALFRAYVAVCRLRMAPQAFPSSPLLLAATMLLYWVLSFATATIDMAAAKAGAVATIDAALLAAFVFAALQLRGYAARYNQTLTALAGAGVVLSAFALPVVWWLHRADAAGQSIDLPLILWTGIFTWSLVVAAHVLRHAMSIHFFAALVVAILYTWISFNAISMLFPPALPADLQPAADSLS